MQGRKNEEMIQIENTVVSLNIVQKNFLCDLSKCKGACCVHGDSGAPLEPEEAKILEDSYSQIKPFMHERGIRAIEKQGNVHMIDSDGDVVTVLVDNKECAFVVFENGIARCSIEKAYNEGTISFRKPVSCHLYPVRINKYREFEAVNYDEWEICKPALEKGDKENVPLYIFLKDSLKRKYGADWYNQLLFVAENIKKEK